MIASTPPMGWNSWDCYGTTVTEEEVLDNAEFMARELLPFGWDTIVVDIAWYDPTARAHGYNEGAPIVLDAYGRQLPAENRFPSSKEGAGFAPLARKIHELRLKLGVHIMRGIPRRAVELGLPILGTECRASDVADREHVCPWNPDNFGLNHDHPGAQAYYDSQVAQFAAWGVDYIKADDMQAPYYEREIAAYSRAIEKSGRDIVLSLSPGTHLSTTHIDHLRGHANVWRISDDLWDRWEDVYAQFARLARWAPLQQPGSWADADMLPLGRIGIRAERGEDRQSRLTLDEQRALLTLWVMGRSPLMMGGDLPSSAPETISLLQNPHFARMLAATKNNRELLREPQEGGELIVWAADSTDDQRRAVALFWTGEVPHNVRLPLPSLLGTGRRDARLRHLWRDVEPATIERGHVEAHLRPHGVCWFTLEM